MIFGEYPCCGAPFIESVPEKTPVYFTEKCPNCGETVWHRISRADPESWTEDLFLELHDVDHETGNVTVKGF